MAGSVVENHTDGFEYCFAWNYSSPGHNCGMQWLSDMYLTKRAPSKLGSPPPNKLGYNSPYEYHPSPFKPSWDKPVLKLEEAWAFWDRNKEKFFAALKVNALGQKGHGFYLISDSVNVKASGPDSAWGGKDVKQTEFKDSYVKTVHFMNWVAARQIGILVRGPVGNNLGHTENADVNHEGRCVTSWWWQPFEISVIDPNVEVLSSSFKPNQQLPKLIENSKEYTDYERSLVPKPEELRRAA